MSNPYAEEEEIKRRERAARESFVVQNLASRLKEEDVTRQGPPVVHGSVPVRTTPVPSAVPAKMSRQEEELMIKQRERAARTAVVPNLSNRMGEGMAPGAQAVRPGAQAARPGAQAVQPAARPPPEVPNKMTRQEEELLLKQRERDARRVSSVVPNLSRRMAEDSGPRPGAVAVGPSSAPAAPAVPPKMTRQEEELMIKQRERDAARPRSARVMQNLADVVGDQVTTSPSRANQQPVARPGAMSVVPGPPMAANAPRNPQLSQAEQDRMSKERARGGVGRPSAEVATRPQPPQRMPSDSDQAQMARQRARGSGRTSAVVPNLSRHVTQSPTQQRGPTSEPARMLSQTEMDAQLKERERSSAPSAGSLDTSRLQARYQAVGALLGEGGEALMEMDAQENVPVAPGVAPRASTGFQPESEDTVRARFQAANLALDGGLTQEDEDQQVKERERQVAAILTRQAARNADQDVINETRAAAQAEAAALIPDVVSQNERDLIAKHQAAGGQRTATDNRDVVEGTFDASPRRRSTQREQDEASKARGRRSRTGSARAPETDNSDVQTGTATVPQNRPARQIAPGALAVADGQAQQRGKGVLTTVEQSTVQDYVAPPTEEGNREIESQMPSNGRAAEAPVGEVELAVSTEKELAEDSASSNRRFYIMLVILFIVVAAGAGGGVAAAGGGGGSSGSDATEAPSASPTIQLSDNYVAARDYFISNGMSSAEQFADPSSSQAQALSWVADSDNIASVVDEDKLRTRYGLAVFYYELDGPSWLSSEGWLDDDTDECDWVIVECEGGSVTGITQEQDNGLTGVIPSELSILPALLKVTIESNSVSGIEGEFGELNRLDLKNIRLDGSFPPAIFTMSKLTRLLMPECGLSGAIPEEIGQLEALEFLDLSDNELNGTLTTQLQPLPSIREIKISNNDVSGEVMQVLDGLVGLSAFIADSCRLNGTIGVELSALTNMRVFAVSDNLLSGDLPDFSVFAPSTQRIDLTSNPDLVGTLATDIGSLTELEDLKLQLSPVKGPIPTEMGRCTRLRHLHLGSMQLDGSIPTEVGLLTRLVEITLNTNSIVGPIPSELGRLTRLSLLQLNENGLSGTIPTEIQELASLEQLWLAQNNLEGEFPIGICNLPDLTHIYLTPPDTVECPVDCDACQ